jgi:hypothetical protein
MSGGHIIRFQGSGALKKQIEFNELIAADAGIWRSAAAVLLDEILNYGPLELAPEIDHIVRNSKPDRHAVGILLGLPTATALEVFGSADLFGQRIKIHGDTDDIVALLLELGRGHGRVHSPAHGHDDFSRRFGSFHHGSF